MLAEHEILELLEQLKFGTLNGASESDPVGHWPVLIGDGLCLNLQSAAQTEFVRQPDQVTVISGLAGDATANSLSSRYQQLHHVSTGLANRSLLIGYDSDCLILLPRLHVSERNRSWSQANCEDDTRSAHAYDFSLAIAASLDLSATVGGENCPITFLPIDEYGPAQLTGGWRVALEFGHSSAEFFIGLLNPVSGAKNAIEIGCPETAEIRVVPESITRSVSTGQICVGLAVPHSLGLRRTTRVGHFQIASQGGDIHLHKLADSQVALQDASLSLMVQRSLQLSVDDLYLLLVEAIGSGVKLTIQFVAESVFGELDNYDEYLLPEHSRLRCLSINNLPVRNAYIVIEAGSFTLISDE